MPSASTLDTFPTNFQDVQDGNFILQPSSSVASSVYHTRLIITTPKAFRVFLRHYDQYVKEVTARALQLAVVDSTTTEPAGPINSSYRVDAE